MYRAATMALSLACLAIPASAANIEVSVYTGLQEAPLSRVQGDDGNTDFNFMAEWEGKSGDTPHVDVIRGNSASFEYQVSGPAIMLAAGVSWSFNDIWAVFGECKGTMSWWTTAATCRPM